MKKSETLFYNGIIVLMPLEGLMNDEELKRFIKLGYLPDTLPKIYSAKTLSELYETYSNLCVDNQDNAPYKFDVYKKRYATRRYSVLNPYNFILLTKRLQDSWSVVADAALNSPLTLTPIQLGGGDEEPAILQISKDKFQNIVFAKSSGMNTVLRTDIVEHYDSTYTHAVAWAIHGKDNNKIMRNAQFIGTGAQKAAARSAYSALAGNVIDRALRDGDEQQTHGIPTGPKTSRIISEVILSAIDVLLHNELGRKGIKYVGGRYVDDYELYFKDEHEAELALQILSRILSSYRYKISEQKTSFTSNPPIAGDEEWSQKLNRLVPEQLKGDLADYSINSAILPFAAVKRFIEEFVLLSKRLNDPRIVRRAIGKYLRSYECSNEDWEYYEIYLQQILTSFPNTAKAIFDIVQHHNNGSSSSLSRTINKNLTNPSVTSFDVMWLAYGALMFDIQIDTNAVGNLLEQDDPMVYLLLAGLNERGLTTIDSDVLQLAWDKYSLHDEGWMFKYEAVRHGWVDDSSRVVASDPFFSGLLAVGVTFFITESSQIQLDESDWFDDYDDPAVDENFDSEPEWDWLVNQF